MTETDTKSESETEPIFSIYHRCNASLIGTIYPGTIYILPYNSTLLLSTHLLNNSTSSAAFLC